jgi:hypothetical protein
VTWAGHHSARGPYRKAERRSLPALVFLQQPQHTYSLKLGTGRVVPVAPMTAIVLVSTMMILVVRIFTITSLWTLENCRRVRNKKKIGQANNGLERGNKILKDNGGVSKSATEIPDIYKNTEYGSYNYQIF